MLPPNPKIPIALLLALAVTLPVRQVAAVPLGQDVFPSEDTNSPTRLPAITVIAQREPAPVQVAPVSVTAVPLSMLRDDDVRYVKDAEIFAPNVFLNEFSARKLSNPYFRGIGSSPNNPGFTTYID